MWVLLPVLGTGNTGLAQLCNLAVDPWPEDTTVSVSNGELRASMSSMWVVQDGGMSRGGNNKTPLFKQEPIMQSEFMTKSPVWACYIRNCCLVIGPAGFHKRSQGTLFRVSEGSSSYLL